MFNDILIFSYPEGVEFDELVIYAGDKVAFHHIVDSIESVDEALQVLRSVPRQRYFSKHGQHISKPRQVDIGRKTPDETGVLQLLQSHEAWTGREMNPVGKIDIREPPILLQL